MHDRSELLPITFEMNRANKLDINLMDESLKQVLSNHPAILLALLFGSIAKGNANPESDIDLAVAANHPLTVNEKMQLIAELAQITGRPVDLVDLTTAGEPLLGQIIAHGKKIVRDDALYAEMINRHLLNQADFMPYKRRILEERRRKWIGC